MTQKEFETEKLELIQWIAGLTDKGTFLNLKALKDADEGKDWWDEISQAEREGIQAGLADIEAGRTYTEN